MLEKRIHHNFPARHFVMSASHNKSRKTQREVDEQIIKRAEEYRKRGAMVSHKFQRVDSAPIDELKFLMPIYKDIPVLAFQVTYAAMQGAKVSVAGSNEVGLVVEALRDYLPIPKENLTFVHEGEKLSIGNSISKGANALKMNKKDFFWFVPLDMPFFYNTMSMLYDRDIINNIIIFDLNARERVFQEYPEIFPRNYYWKMNDKGKRYNVKEFAVLGLSAGMNLLNLFSVANNAYEHRQAGAFGAKQVISMVSGNILKHAYTAFDRLEVIDMIDFVTFATQFAFSKKDSRIKPAFKAETFEHLGYFIDMAPVRCKAEHQDPFRIKDVDAWHDLWYYALVIQQNGGIKGIVPYADYIEGFDDVMKKIKSDVGVLKDFPEYANQRAKDLRMERLPFRNREFVAEPAPRENLEESIKVLHKQMEIFEENRHLHFADYTKA